MFRKLIFAHCLFCIGGLQVHDVIAQERASSSTEIQLTILQRETPLTHKEIFSAIREKIKSGDPALLRCSIRFTPKRNLATLLYYQVFSNWLRSPDHINSFQARGSVMRLFSRMSSIFFRKPNYTKRVDFDLEINESLDYVIVNCEFQFAPENRKSQRSCLSFAKRLERHLKSMKRGADEIIIELVDD